MNNFVASLHTHVRSLFDADISPNRLCKKIKEMGGEGCAITDHGVLSSIEDYRAVFNSEGLKMIPGVELYVDGGILGRLHVVLLSVNDQGYHAISRIVTESNKTLQSGFPVISEARLAEMMTAEKGNVIALSACMQGVISVIFLLNDKVNKKIDAVKRKQAKYTNPASAEYFEAQEALKECEEKACAAIKKRDETKSIAEQPFAKREKAVAKLESSGAENAEEERNILESDKKAALRAAEELPKVKEELESAKKALSSATKRVKALDESIEKFFELEEEINALKRELKNEEELDEMAKGAMKRYIEIFGKDCFYAEIQYHGIPEEAICFPRLVKIARELNVPLVATNDVHILENTEDERLRRQVLRSLRFGDNFEEENTGDGELYLKNNDELKEMFQEIFAPADIDEAIANINVIFNRCNVEFNVGKHYPKYSTENTEEIFDAEIEKGITWRFPEGIDNEHIKRLEYEKSIIKSMGYVDYHLVVKDFLEYGRLLGFVPDDKLAEAPLSVDALKEYIAQNGWVNGGLTIGPGRGSAVGSLVCYLLGITNLDPIKYELLFERFLNPERISMPDIDSDFSSTIREKVIEYVRAKYGQNSVCGIMTMTFQGPKGSINIAAKYYGYKKYGEPLTSLGREISKDVPADVGTVFDSPYDDTTTVYGYLLAKYTGNKDAQNVLKWARILEGSFTSYSSHAAGVVISDGVDVAEYLPLRSMGEGMMTTQCTKEQVEDNGLLKFDFLGLKTLDIITQAIRLIDENRGIIIDLLKINLSDSRVYKEIFSQGKTNAVFQFESQGMKSMLKRFKPESFEDLIILVSMFRPGPLQYLDDVISIKNGKKPMTFLCPQLEPILGKTYGAIVYQEQVMQICQSLAGFTLGHADQVRKFMSKKKADKLAHEREVFVKGCSDNGISEETSNTLFDQMMDFASYAFNKSHAAAYAFNAYVTAWLKLYYPSEFFTAALNWTTPKKLAGLMYEAKAFGVEVKAPDINLSGQYFEDKSDVVRFGISSVKGIKNHAVEILKERKNGRFTSLSDFIRRCNPNIKVVSNLIDAGAFDEFSTNRSAMKLMTKQLGDTVSNITKKESFIKSASEALPKYESFKTEEGLMAYQTENGLKPEVKKLGTVASLEKKIETARTGLVGLEKELSLIREPKILEDNKTRMNAEKELLGIYVTKHPIDFYPTCEEVSVTPIDDVDTLTTSIYGVIENLSIKARKKDGAKMAFFSLEDKSGTIEVSCFTKEFAEFGRLINEGDVVKISGNVIEEQHDTGDEVEIELKFVAKKIETVEEKKCSYMISVPSYAAFFLDGEEAFMSMFKDENGHNLIIYDRALNEIREATYKVSDKCKTLANVEEVYV